MSIYKTNIKHLNDITGIEFGGFCLTYYFVYVLYSDVYDICKKLDDVGLSYRAIPNEVLSKTSIKVELVDVINHIKSEKRNSKINDILNIK